jgi:geranylgeranyl reductase family protein
MSENDILISGAGPAGAATSLFLSRLNIPHTIIDKATFPRDKICGDALSGKVVTILNKLDNRFAEEIADNSKDFTGSYGISFFAPNGRRLDIPFSTNPDLLKNPPGFISKRLCFDNYLFGKIDKNYANVLENTTLIDLEKTGDGVVAKLKSGENIFEKKYKLVVGADGERSLVGKKLIPAEKDLASYCAALRVYYKEVGGMHIQNYIELHFIKDLLPGYFWIFPMNDGSANVGIGMLSKTVARKKINLRNKLNDIISKNESIKDRFTNASQDGEIQGWGLPLGSARKKLTTDNCILTGDSASLIDPFTGEGIGNAMYSGMLAAETISSALKENNFTNDFLKTYESKLYHNLEKELNISHRIQGLARNAWLFNLVVNKAVKNKAMREMLTCMFEDVDMRKRLKQPSFYVRLLFN